MLQLAEALIEQKDTKFDPKDYEDRYETALMAMIKEKLKGHKPIIAAAPERGNVINLMDALKASLAQAEAAGEEQEQGASRGGAGGRKPAAAGGRQGRRPRARSDVTQSPARVFGTGRRAGRVAAAAGRARGRAPARAAAGAASPGAPRIVVFGRALLGTRRATPQIEARFDAEREAGRQPLSENGFLRLLGLVEVAERRR